MVEEFSKYQSIPQIKQLTERWVWSFGSCDCHMTLTSPRLESVQYDLAQQIRVDFEKSFSIKGAPVSGCHSNSGSVIVMRSPLHCLFVRLVLNISCTMPVRSWIFLEDGKSMMSLLRHFIVDILYMYMYVCLCRLGRS